MPDDLLPPNATPPERALSLATGREVAVPVRQLWNPQTCPAGILPWLAWSLSVDEWDPAWPEQTQRNTIAASIEQHRRKGTIGALRQALSRLGYEVEIDEQTGAAYTFALRLKLNDGDSAGGAVAGDDLNKAVEIALKTKNVRSKLDNTKFLGTAGEAFVYVGGASVIGTEVEIGSGNPTPLPLDGLQDYQLASLWTVRMANDYAGPIGRVQRTSDNATLDYSSVAELQAFVGAGAWNYLGLFSQKTGVYHAVTSGAQVKGLFDAGGLPYALVQSNFAFLFAVDFSEVTPLGLTLIMANHVYPDALGQGQSYSDAQFLDSRNLPCFGLTNSSPFADPPMHYVSNGEVSDFAEVALAEPEFVAGARIGGGTLSVTNGISNQTDTGAIPAKAAKLQVALEDATGNDAVARARFYGFAGWKRDFGLTELDAKIASIKARLQF